MITRLLPAELGSLTAADLLLEPFALVDLRLSVVFLVVVLLVALPDEPLLVVIYRRGFPYFDVVHTADLFYLSFQL